MPKATKAKETTDKKEKKAKEPSPYNVFMKTEVPKVRKENPDLGHKEAFSKAASNWKNSPANPKNKKK